MDFKPKPLAQLGGSYAPHSSVYYQVIKKSGLLHVFITSISYGKPRKQNRTIQVFGMQLFCSITKVIATNAP